MSRIPLISGRKEVFLKSGVSIEVFLNPPLASCPRLSEQGCAGVRNRVLDSGERDIPEFPAVQESGISHPKIELLFLGPKSLNFSTFEFCPGQYQFPESRKPLQNPGYVIREPLYPVWDVSLPTLVCFVIR